MEKGEDFVVRDNLADLVAGMNALSGDDLLDHDRLRAQIEARDREVQHSYSKDAQVAAIHNARRYIGDSIFRVTKPHRILDPAHGPLIAVRLSILTRKTLGGLHTNLQGQVLDAAGEPIPGLYAAGEVAGGGGGGYHGYNALEGTFLGSCIFMGRNAGPARGGAVASLAFAAPQMLVEPRHDLDEVAGHVAVVELRLRGCRPRRRGRRRASPAAQRRRWR